MVRASPLGNEENGMSQRALGSFWSVSVLLLPLVAGGCGGSDKAVVEPGPDMAAGSGGNDMSAGNTLTETALTVSLEFVAPTAGASDGGVAASEQLRITTRDGSTAVRTDIWLYTLTGGKLQELDAFTAPTGRQQSHLM